MECRECKIRQDDYMDLCKEHDKQAEEIERLKENLTASVDILLGTDIEDGNSSDNLAVAICAYFDSHMSRPDNDEDDAETAWEKWVQSKYERTVELLNQALKESEDK